MPMNKGAEERKARRKRLPEARIPDFFDFQAYRAFGEVDEARRARNLANVSEGLREGLRQLERKRITEQWLNHPWYRALRALGNWVTRMGERITSWGTPGA